MSRVQGLGPALTALVSGSMVLGGKICRCIPAAVSWAWDMAVQDPAATAEKQERADAAARKRAAAKLKNRKARRRKKATEDDADDDLDDGEDDVDPESVTAPPVDPVVRGRGDAAVILLIGSALAAGGLYSVWQLVGAAAFEFLAPHQPLIMCGGGLAWMAAAWMLSPPPPAMAAAEDQADADEEFDPEDLEDDAEEDAPEPSDGLSPAQRLQRHILEQLAALEVAHGGRGGLHVVSLIASAEQAGLLSPGAMTKKQMRDWLEASKFPVAKSTRQPKGVPPLGGEVDYGVKIEELAGVLGSSVSEAVRRMYGTPVSVPPPAPVQTPAQAPAGPPSEAPAGAVAGGVPGPRLRLVQPLSPDLSQGSTQDTA